MKSFLDKNFLLNSQVAQELYQETAAGLPIVDFHNHLDPASLATNKKAETIGDLWVMSDPYKHRAMRINGVPEHYISGGASSKEKFFHWAATLPKTIGNPLFHWSCIELKHVFGIDKLLNSSNAEEIWNECNYIIKNRDFGIRNILKHWNTEIVCTSDDLLDDLSFHTSASNNTEGLSVLPSLRGDSIIDFGTPGFFSWFDKLEKHNGAINNLDDYCYALVAQMDVFTKHGCRLADHSFDAGFTFIPVNKKEVSSIFRKYLDSRKISDNECHLLQSFLLFFLGKEYHRRNWTLQLHIGAQRYTSSRLRALAGTTGGYACIGDSCNVKSLCHYFDTLEKESGLPNLILYTLNPSDNAVLATLTGSFSEDNVPGKIQFGPAWWYNDSLEGIRSQLLALSGYGLLSHFVGMTTDSRSVLSFSRHDYFRRILCDMLGSWVGKGHVPYNRELLHGMVKDICYNNSRNMITNENRKFK